MKFYIPYIILFFYCMNTAAQEDTIPKDISAKVKHNYVQNSVLASGSWIQLKVKDEGIYRITFNDLIQYGINPASINPLNIRIYGNGGGMLSESNADYSPDDLIENAIYIDGESDGKFDPGDYILFYGQSQVKWFYDATQKIFKHRVNYYSDETFYFLTYNNGAGKRIKLKNSVSQAPTQIITKFNDFAFHEKDSLNLIKSGKEWYGESFETKTSYNFIFPFPNIDKTNMAVIRAGIAARNSTESVFIISAEGYSDTLIVPSIPGQATADYAKISEDTFHFLPSESNPDILINKITQTSVGWLNFIEINVVRHLIFSGEQMFFRNTSTVGAGNISEFRISGVSSPVKVWDITNPYNIFEQEFLLNGSNLQFRAYTDSLRQYVVFDESAFLSPGFSGIVQNQNLHGFGQPDMVIVSHPDFILQAKRLAQIHVDIDNFNVIIVTPQEIYNEFSSGSQDISAIRNFMRMFYNRDTVTTPKYLLLFGDGSFDYKNRFADNTNFVPTYESFSSLVPTSSHVTDDFFGLLDPFEGYSSNGSLNIGIGRFPVKTAVEAKAVVDKIENYIKRISTITENNGCNTYTKEIPGDWRNIVCFAADDEDNNLHLGQANELAAYVDTANNNMNIDKIYLDAYKQVVNSSGPSYPDANKALNKRVQDGALVINYTGHGGETGWSAEKLLQNSDINSWTNSAALPVFVTATCEFSRFDDPERTSAGENILLNPVGGGIALFTTTRMAFSNSNFGLNKSICKYAYKKYNGEYLRLGDIMKLSKTENGSSVNNRNFVLLGDPALKLSFPENSVITTEINGQPADSAKDTLKACSMVTVSGIIQNSSGQKMTNFNGIIYPSVFDKKYPVTTLANDPASSHYVFFMQNHVLFEGRSTVTNGEFTFTFILPKDMGDDFGVGRISYYAKDSSTDASGFYENNNLLFGGSDSSAISDDTGPLINLFFNTTDFVYGGFTDSNPVFIAALSDQSGINYSGFTFGHDITAILDENTDNTILLNDFFIPDMDSYTGGTVIFPFKDLPFGKHTLRLKAWDNYNNSAEAYTEFNVANQDELSLKNLYNYPNPFSDKTYFSFQYEQRCCDMDVEIKIYSITGALVKTINQITAATNSGKSTVEWNGRNDGGNRLESGIYIYKISVKNSEGEFLESSNKLFLIK